jgi:phosphatidylserine/phosphatidylglycerophosphate/cardiolipin synthase-like enzyme
MKRVKITFYIATFTAIFSIFGMLFTGEKPAEIKDGSNLIAGSEYAEKVLALLKNAKKRIYVSMYVMRYSQSRAYSIENIYIKALIDRYKRGVDVKVILDASHEWSKKRHSLSGPRSDKNDNAYNALKKAGVPVVYDSMDQTMHAKTIVIDEELCIIGSTNWSYSALKKNVEFSVLIKSKSQTEKMAQHFKRLWTASENKKVWIP